MVEFAFVGSRDDETCFGVTLNNERRHLDERHGTLARMQPRQEEDSPRRAPHTAGCDHPDSVRDARGSGTRLDRRDVIVLL